MTDSLPFRYDGVVVDATLVKGLAKAMQEVVTGNSDLSMIAFSTLDDDGMCQCALLVCQMPVAEVLREMMAERFGPPREESDKIT